MPTCLISFGANLGEPRDTLTRVVQLLQMQEKVAVSAVSEGHLTKPVGGPPGQSDYLNAAIRIETDLAAAELQRVLQRAETLLGRTRSVRWNARLVDLDLLLYGTQTTDTPDLTVPHPRMSFRRFVLQPAVEVAGEMVHPETGLSLRSLLSHLDDADNYVALVGPTCSCLSAVVAQLVEDRSHVAVLDPHPAGRSGAAGIESTLRARVEALRSAAARAVAARSKRGPLDHAYLISDFWCEHALVDAAVHHPSEVGRISEVWRQLQAALPVVKLLVVMPSESSDTSAAEWRAIARHLAAAPVGPVLRLASGNLQQAVVEICAALEAMGRPSTV